MSRALKYPGTIPDPQLEEWFADQTASAAHVNPCVRLHGLAEPEAKCKDCRLFIRKQKGKTYFKCALRGDTNGPATDHRANWPACGRFVRAENLATDQHR